MLTFQTFLASTGGAIALGAVVASALPTSMKPAPEPPWRAHYEAQAFASQSAQSGYRLVDSGPIDLSPDLPMPAAYRDFEVALMSETAFDEDWGDLEPLPLDHFAAVKQVPIPEPVTEERWSAPERRSSRDFTAGLTSKPQEPGTIPVDTSSAGDRPVLAQTAQQTLVEVSPTATTASEPAARSGSPVPATGPRARITLGIY